MTPDVAILIVTYNSERQIAGCLRSVHAEGERYRQEVIIVDNGSTDGTVALLQAQFPEVKLIIPGRNLGFAAGVNLAARHASAEYLLLLNPDTVLLDRATDVIVDFARAHPQYGFYGGRTLKPDGSLEPSSCWALPSLWSLFTFATGLSTAAPRNRWLDPESMGAWKRDSIREVGIITGCFLLVARTAWQRLGGFDERYFMYGEDADLALRARRAGYRPVICPDARLVHEIGQSSSTPAAKLLLLYRGKASFLRTHWVGWRQRAGLSLLKLGVGLRAALGTLQGGRNHRWRTVWDQRHVWLQGYPAQTSKPATPTQPAFA